MSLSMSSAPSRVRAASRFDTNSREQLGRLIDNSVFHNQRSFANVTDVGYGIAVHESKVGQLTGSNGTEVAVEMHDSCSIKSRILQNLACRDSRLHIQLEFAMEREPRHRVCSFLDRNARSVYHPD